MLLTSMLFHKGNKDFVLILNSKSEPIPIIPTFIKLDFSFFVCMSTTAGNLLEDIPHLGAEEVIDEVFNLLGRMEADRTDTCTLYDKEQKRVDWLQGRIDKLAAKRMHELPKVVQNGKENRFDYYYYYYNFTGRIASYKLTALRRVYFAIQEEKQKNIVNNKAIY